MKNTNIKELLYFDSINSTNEYILDNYDKFNDSTLCISNHQTKGRGRLGHNWVSNGDNIYMSLLLKPYIEVNKPYLLTLVTGIALSKALDKLYSINTLIKWPNDIFLNNYKIAGILVETKYSNKLECIVIGVGINVNQLDFNNEELINASSLYRETNSIIDKEIIINEFINNFYNLYNEYLQYGFHVFIKDINKKLYILNKEVYVTNNPSINGICVGISEDGELLIKTNNNIISLNSKEVSIKVK